MDSNIANKINAKQKAKVASKYPGAIKNQDIFIGGSSSQSAKPKHKRGPKLPVYKEIRDKIV